MYSQNPSQSNSEVKKDFKKKSRSAYTHSSATNASSKINKEPVNSKLKEEVSPIYNQTMTVIEGRSSNTNNTVLSKIISSKEEIIFDLREKLRAQEEEYEQLLLEQQ